MKTNFCNKNGDLSLYALCCGYVIRREYNGSYAELFMEHSHFHVKTGKIGECYKQWDTFNSNELTQARKRLNEFIKEIK